MRVGAGGCGCRLGSRSPALALAQPERARPGCTTRSTSRHSPTSPHISPYLAASPYTSPHLPISPCRCAPALPLASHADGYAVLTLALTLLLLLTLANLTVTDPALAYHTLISLNSPHIPISPHLPTSPITPHISPISHISPHLPASPRTPPGRLPASSSLRATGDCIYKAPPPPPAHTHTHTPPPPPPPSPTPPPATQPPPSPLPHPHPHQPRPAPHPRPAPLTPTLTLGHPTLTLHLNLRHRLVQARWHRPPLRAPSSSSASPYIVMLYCLL